MKKLTNAQARIVSLLMDNPYYVIKESGYGAHQASIINTGKMGEFESPLVTYFYQSTFEILISTGLFTEVSKGQFGLTQNIIKP